MADWGYKKHFTAFKLCDFYLPPVTVCSKNKDITPPLWISSRQLCAAPSPRSLLCCVSSLSLDTVHCTSSFISRLCSDLISPGETHFFPRLSICPTSSLWLSISLSISPPVCRSFPLYNVILPPIAVATPSLLLLLIPLIWLFQPLLF